MAFQCRGCYKNKKLFDSMMSRSHGPCENCHYTDICIDVPFNTDPKWKKNLERDLALLAEQKAKK